MRPKQGEEGYFLGWNADEDDFLVRTAATDAAALSKASTTPVMQRDGVVRPPVLPIATREDIIMCILHCTMAMGRLAGLYIMRRCSEATDEQKALVSTELIRRHLKIKVYARGADLLKPPNLKGHQVSDLFKAWRESIADLLGEETSEGVLRLRLAHFQNLK